MYTYTQSFKSLGSVRCIKLIKSDFTRRFKSFLFNPLITFICVYTHYLWGLQGSQTMTFNFVTE